MFRSSCRVAVVEDRGIPLVKYSVPEAEELIRELRIKRDQARERGDVPGFRFFKQWVLDLKTAVKETRAERSLDCP